MQISAEKIVSMRKERGWSQEKLAAMAGVSDRTIQRAESDGNCSLDTKMALASAFDVSPLALQAAPGIEAPIDTTFTTSWAGALGLFLLGLGAPAVVLLTATDGKWELISMALVWGLTITLSMMRHGARQTYELFDRTSWIVKYPSHVTGLNNTIMQAASAIQHAYLVGLIAALVAALTITAHAPAELAHPVVFVTYAIRPLVYSLLLSELWLRPFKWRLESMMAAQKGAAPYMAVAPSA